MLFSGLQRDEKEGTGEGGLKREREKEKGHWNLQQDIILEG